MMSKDVAALKEALEFYADPTTYFAIGFWPDPPCGEFAEDFSEDHGSDEAPGFRPGKRAREALHAYEEGIIAMSEDAIVERLRNDPDFPAAFAHHYREREGLIEAVIEELREDAALKPFADAHAAMINPEFGGSIEDLLTADDFKRAHDVIYGERV